MAAKKSRSPRTGIVDWRDPAAVRQAFEQNMTALTAGGRSKKAKIVTGNVARHLVPRLERIAEKYARNSEPHPWAMAANHCSEIFLDAKSDVIAEIENDLAMGRAEKLTNAELAEAKELDKVIQTPTGLRDPKSH